MDTQVATREYMLDDPPKRAVAVMTVAPESMISDTTPLTETPGFCVFDSNLRLVAWN